MDFQYYNTIGFHINIPTQYNTLTQGRLLPIIKHFYNRGLRIFGMFIVIEPTRPTLFCIEKQETEEIYKFVKDTGIKIFVHSSFLSHPWTGKSFCIRLILNEIRLCMKISAYAYLLHLPKKSPDAIREALEKYVIPAFSSYESKNTAIANEQHHKLLLLLELIAVKPVVGKCLTYESIENIQKLWIEMFALMKTYPFMQIKLCLDTAHVYALGNDISKIENMKPLLEFLEDQKIIGLVHLNDNKTLLGCGKDIHANLCRGNIWKELNAQQSLIFLLRFCKQHEIPIVMETPQNPQTENDYTTDLQTISKLMKPILFIRKSQIQHIP